MPQLKGAVNIADAKYPKVNGWRVVWVFDHSCDALQHVHESWRLMVGWKASFDELFFGDLKGMQRVLEKRGVDT